MDRWMNVELETHNGNAKMFKDFLHNKGIPFEASAAENLIHFEVLIDLSQVKEVNDFLMSL